jgi:Ni/Co efflux regulator RcnB
MGVDWENIMRRLLLAGLAGMMLAGPVLADERDNRHERRDHREDRQDFRHDRRDIRRDRRDFRFNERDFRQSRQNEWRWAGQRHRERAYNFPRGYRYQPYGVGIRLPQPYFGGGYWINDPGYYRLPPAYRGTRWVRVGPDALLVNIGNGVVISVVRGLYW